MSKTNFTKVEEAFTEGLRKIEVEKLLRIADENSSKKPQKRQEPSLKRQTLEQKSLLLTLKYDLKALVKTQGKEVYKKIGIEKELLNLLKDSAVIKEEEWGNLKALKEKINAYKEELAKGGSKEPQEDLVEKEWKDQKIKRFNINKNWIPLR